LEYLFDDILSILNEGKGLVIATIIRQAGSAPRELGTRMIIDEDGKGYGTIGGGKLEAEVMAQAPALISRAEGKVVQFLLTGKDADDSGMICGGQADVFLDPVFANDKHFYEVIEKARAVIDKGSRGIMVENVSPGKIGLDNKSRFCRWLFLGEGGQQAGVMDSDDVLQSLKERVLEFLTAGTPVLVPAGEIPGQTHDVFIHPISLPHRVILFGGGHICLHLAKLVKMIGLSLIVADDREEFVNPDRFPEADDLWYGPFDTVFEGRPVRVNDYLVIVTRGHNHDLTVLRQALETRAGYIGMIGSRRKKELVFKKLIELGYSTETLQAVHAPIGIDIMAQTPEEIAVSIIAEIIQEKRTKARLLKDWEV